MVLADQAAFNPEGKPMQVPILVAPVVVCKIVINVVFMHMVGIDDAMLTVFSGVARDTLVTMIVPVAFTIPQPPVKGIL